MQNANRQAGLLYCLLGEFAKCYALPSGKLYPDFIVTSAKQGGKNTIVIPDFLYFYPENFLSAATLTG